MSATAPASRIFGSIATACAQIEKHTRGLKPGWHIHTTSDVYGYLDRTSGTDNAAVIDAMLG